MATGVYRAVPNCARAAGSDSFQPDAPGALVAEHSGGGAAPAPGSVKCDLTPCRSCSDRGRAEAFVLGADPLLFSYMQEIVGLAARHRLPAVYEHRRFAEAGGLLSYGPLTHERFGQMAGYVDRILRGARPGDLRSASSSRRPCACAQTT